MNLWLFLQNSCFACVDDIEEEEFDVWCSSNYLLMRFIIWANSRQRSDDHVNCCSPSAAPCLYFDFSSSVRSNCSNHWCLFEQYNIEDFVCDTALPLWFSIVAVVAITRCASDMCAFLLQDVLDVAHVRSINIATRHVNRVGNLEENKRVRRRVWPALGLACISDHHDFFPPDHFFFCNLLKLRRAAERRCSLNCFVPLSLDGIWYSISWPISKQSKTPWAMTGKSLSLIPKSKIGARKFDKPV